MARSALIDSIGRLPLMGPADFHAFQVRLVSLYRADERSQEEIAVGLTAINLSLHDSLTTVRVNEIFAMLQHVHDPFITGSNAAAP